MKEFAEGMLLCVGVGAFYLAADANEKGNLTMAVVCLTVGIALLTLMILVASDRGRMK